ncbi:hypothetical protein DL96DRAFT_1620181 [Flagelloscypha sp. PMI_526]|nr:hypothetical protein DL96DRAFT_1620181 [Flagelloscypha sp. PMI_526]
MASGLLRAQPLNSQLPVPSSAKSGLSPPEGPSPAMLIRQEWSKKEEAKEKDRLKSFRFGNSSASNTPTSPSFEKDVLSALETLDNASTFIYFPSLSLFTSLSTLALQPYRTNSARINSDSEESRIRAWCCSIRHRRQLNHSLLLSFHPKHLHVEIGSIKNTGSECFSPLSDMPSLVGSSALTDEEQECNSDAGASHLADDTALSDSPIIVQEPFESTEDTTIIPGSSKPPVLDPPPTCSLAASVSKSSEENNRRTKFLGAFRRSQTLDTSTSLSPPASPTPPTTKKAGRSSIFRRSKTLSGKSPKVDPLSLPPSPFLKSSFDKTGLPTTPTSPTHFESRLAVSPTIHNRQSMIAELEDIEDDEARRTAEMMFLD